MSNVLAEEKRQQILALGRLGWSLRQIERATGVRRETASNYLRAAGVVVRGRGRPPAHPAKPAISSEVSTDSSGSSEVSTDSPGAPSAGTDTGHATSVSAGHPGRAPGASACEPYRELIAEALGPGAMPWPSGRTWSTTTVSRLAMQAYGASSRRSDSSPPSRRGPSSPPPRARTMLTPALC